MSPIDIFNTASPSSAQPTAKSAFNTNHKSTIKRTNRKIYLARHSHGNEKRPTAQKKAQPQDNRVGEPLRN